MHRLGGIAAATGEGRRGGRYGPIQRDLAPDPSLDRDVGHADDDDNYSIYGPNKGPSLTSFYIDTRLDFILERFQNQLVKQSIDRRADRIRTYFIDEYGYMPPRVQQLVYGHVHNAHGLRDGPPAARHRRQIPHRQAQQAQDQPAAAGSTHSSRQDRCRQWLDNDIEPVQQDNNTDDDFDILAGIDDDSDDPVPGPSGVGPADPLAGTSDEVNDMVNQLLSDNINHEHQLESIDNVAESTEMALQVATTGLEELRRILEPYNGEPTAPPIPSTGPPILPGNVVRHRGKVQPSYDSSHLPDDGDRTLTLPPIRRRSPPAHVDQAAPEPQDADQPTPPTDAQPGDDRHASPPHNGGPPGDGGPPGGGPGPGGPGGPGGGPPQNGGPPLGGPAARYDEGAQEKIRRTLARYCNQQQSTRATTRRIMDIVHDATLHAMV